MKGRFNTIHTSGISGAHVELTIVEIVTLKMLLDNSIKQGLEGDVKEEFKTSPLTVVAAYGSDFERAIYPVIQGVYNKVTKSTASKLFEDIDLQQG